MSVRENTCLSSYLARSPQYVYLAPVPVPSTFNLTFDLRPKALMSDQPERKQINFTIIPDEQPGEPRTYANFCSIAHTPFDFTLTFCEVMPLSDKELREAESEHIVR